MKNIAIVVVLALLVIARPSSGQERDIRSPQRTATGILLVLGGAGSIAAAFNYKRDCAGYRSSFREGLYGYDYCTTVAGRHAHTEETPWDIRLARKPLLYAGAGAVVFGTLLATVWADVPAARVVRVEPLPGGVRATKTWSF